MLTIAIAQTGFERIKRHLRDTLPDVPSAHRAEAAARGLGFRTNAALRVGLAGGPRTVPVDRFAFLDHLSDKGFPTRDGNRFVEACAREAIRAVSAGQPTLGPAGFREPLRSGSDHGHFEYEDFDGYLDWAKAAMLEDHSVAGFAAAWRHLSLPHRQGALAGEHRVRDLRTRIEAAERVDILPGVLVAAAIHLGFRFGFGWSPSREIVITVPAPDPEPSSGEDWIALALDAGETLKEEGRNRFRRALAEDRFDAPAARDVIRALWIRAFSRHLDVLGRPDWKTYGRMLLADPELLAFSLGGHPPKDLFLARKGIEELCGGTAIPGIAPGYTHVFEGNLKALLQPAYEA